MRLLLAELLRFWTRRLVIITVPIMILTSAAIAIPAGLATYPVSAAEQAQAQVEYNKELAVWATQCPQGQASKCDFYQPSIQDFLRTPTSASDALGLVSMLKLNLINLACLLIGTSFIAAELRSGTMSTWLTFNPQRHRVYLSKLAAVMVSTAAITATACATAVLSLAITMSLGQVAFTVPGVWHLIGWNALGGALFAAVAVAIGMITRHTAAGLGIAIGINVLEGVASIGLMLLPSLGWLGKYLPGTQLGALFANGSTYYLPSFDDGAPLELPITAGEAAGYWLVVAIGLTALGMFSFARREVR
jgi:ABC-2 type transport system permease protein